MKTKEELAQLVMPIMEDIITPETIEAHDSRPWGFTKYLIYWAYYMKRSCRRRNLLGIDKMLGKRILDIATGVGFFPFVCSEGNEVFCTEDAAGQHIEVYKEIHRRLGLICNYFHIGPRQPLPITGEFDIITSFDICWNKVGTGRNKKRWLIDDYRFMFDDLVSHLAPDGKIYLKPLQRSNLKSLGLKLIDKYNYPIEVI